MNLMTPNIPTTDSLVGSTVATATSAEDRIAAYDWKALIGELDGYGCAVIPRRLS